MIPIYLEMNAFGPYADKQAIDFQVLEDRKLFLIYGPTGAGKTTILDAMCYALYGDTSGDRRSGTHMRSEYASPEQPTYVVFLFAVGYKRYRIERSPEQQIAKKRGTGLRKAASAAVLYEVDENGNDTAVIATKNVNIEIERILGFKSEQFRQVVLLPQGDFRKLLLANSSDRQQIMQTLFRTQRYARLQEIAKEQHDVIKDQYQMIAGHIEQCLQAAGAADAEMLSCQAAQLRTNLQHTEYALKVAGKDRDAYQTVVQQAQALFSHWQALKISRGRQVALEAERDAFKRRRLRLEALRRAQLLAEPCRHVDEIQKKGSAAGKKAVEAGKELEQARIRLMNVKKSNEELEKKHDAYQQDVDRLARLQGLLEKAQNYGQLCRTAAAMQAVSDQSSDRLNALSQMLNTYKQKLEDRQTAAAGQADLAAAFEKTKAGLTALRERLQRELSAESLHATITAAEASCKEASAVLSRAAAQSHQDSVDYESVHALFLQGQAALLAEGLIDGQACPVCGSEAHPHLAVTVENLPQKEDVERRKQQAAASEGRRQQAEVAVRTKEAALREQQRQYAELRRQSPFAGTSQEWQMRLHTAERELTVLQAQVRQAARLSEELLQLQQDAAAMETSVQAARQQAEHDRLAMARAMEAKAQAERDLPEAYRQVEYLRSDIERLSGQLRQYERQLRQVRQDVLAAETVFARWGEQERMLAQQVTELRCQYTEVFAVLKERILQAGFATVQECRELQKDISCIEEEQAVLAAYEKDVQQVQGQIQQEEQAVGRQDEPDMEAYGRTLTEKNEECRRLSEEAARIAGQLKQLEEAQTRVRNWQQEQSGLTEQYKTMGAVYELISGRQTGVNFERYVLGALLDEVLTAANGRLDQMSRHRYELQRSHTWDDKRIRQIGLDIEVFDNYTGYARPANTLSGGETFLASLALALGLADIVQAYSGGIHLDTIFIDEGFGTLDGETLDFALQTLLELKQGGRLVGIISHVPELRERIDTRLAVHKTDRGSTVAFELL